MPKDELPNHNCIKHLRSVVQQQQTKISELEKTVAEHKHQLGEQVSVFCQYIFINVTILGLVNVWLLLFRNETFSC